MPLDAVPLDALTEAHLQRLIQDREQESRTIEFKLVLPGPTDGDKKEFLADFTSFANTAGGDLIYGIRAQGGIAEEIVGLTGDLDADAGRLENIIRTGIQPRVTGYTAKIIALANGKKVLLFRIQRSMSLPHRVTFQSHDKFYGRNSTGKYPLDVPELRSLFLLSESNADKIRNFRAERISSILSGLTPISLASGPKTVIHVIPFNAFSGGPTFPVSTIYDPNILPLRPPSTIRGFSNLHNLDGIATYSHMEDRTPPPSYLQLFRTGAIEAVDSKIICLVSAQRSGYSSDRILVHGHSFETKMMDCTHQYLGIQETLGVSPPVVIMVSLLSVKGAAIHPVMAILDQPSIDRDHVLLSEVTSDTFAPDLGRLLKPIFDLFWNACGYPRSPSYGDDGMRRPDRS
jgi:hypothetical protein